jgi:hypothetical protein
MEEAAAAGGLHFFFMPTKTIERGRFAIRFFFLLFRFHVF